MKKLFEYDQKAPIILRVPKQYKMQLMQHAEANYYSMNAYIIQLLMKTDPFTPH